MPNLPPVIFRRDHAPNEREKINHLLDIADKGPSDESSAAMVSDSTATERSDLYDGDRTVILRKLSHQSVIDRDNSVEENVEENPDANQLSVEQLQRRMKAFALTKRMKRMEKQRSAIDGIMAIEKDRLTREHFSVNDQEEEKTSSNKEH